MKHAMMNTEQKQTCLDFAARMDTIREFPGGPQFIIDLLLSAAPNADLAVIDKNDVDAMTLRNFHNALRLLQSIDLGELTQAGLHLEDDAWVRFRDDPHLFFIKADDRTAGVIWGIVKARMSKKEPKL